MSPTRSKPFPRPEHPRPQMLRDQWLSLNGIWSFELDSGGSGEERGMHLGRTLKERIMVPFCPESRLSGVGIRDFMPYVWYQRTFNLPETWKGKRILLHFGAVDYEATVWVNGQLAGKHQGGYSSFSFEVTRLLKKKENLVVVRAKDDNRSSLQPAGKQSPKLESYGCLYTRTTGIWQTVWLEAVPETYLDSFKLFSDPGQGTLTVLAELAGETSGLTLRCRALSSGKKVGEAELPARNFMILTLKLSEVNLWQPGNPFLYDLDFSLLENGKQRDLVKSYFGFRTISIQDKKVLINGQSVFQRLVLDQGYYPDGIYTAPDDNSLRRDIKLSMAMGFNGARLHEKIFEPRFLYWADQMGYLVWGEYPNWGLDHSHPLTLERMQPEWLEVVKRDFNHPSIIGWCPFNETSTNQNPELVRNIYKLTKSLDPTRPVIDTSGYVHVQTDIYDCHNYEQDPKKFAACFKNLKKKDVIWQNRPKHDAPYRGQPYFVSEYGGTWWDPSQKGKKNWGYGDRPKTKAEFLERYRRLTEVLLFHPKIFGFCYTQLYDVEQEVNGLYTYGRKPKFDPKVIKKINSQKAAIETNGSDK